MSLSSEVVRVEWAYREGWPRLLVVRSWLKSERKRFGRGSRENDQTRMWRYRHCRTVSCFYGNVWGGEKTAALSSLEC